jgi:general secretion pathway protein B
MSEILDALKKLDREKSLRRSGTRNMATEILRPDERRRRKGLPLTIVIVSLAASAAAGIAYAVMVQLGLISKSPSSVQISSPTPVQQAAPTPTEPSVPSKPTASVNNSLPAPTHPGGTVSRKSGTPPEIASIPARKPSPPVQRVQPAPIEPAPFSAAPVEPAPVKPVPVEPAVASKPTPPAPIEPPTPPLPRVPQPETSQPLPKVPAPAEKEAPPAKISLEPKEATRKPIPAEPEVASRDAKPTLVAPPVGTATAPPSLKITVVVWDEDPSKRWAMINGMKVSEGSVIEGAKVVEIQLNRVRFSHNGLPFEISMN